MFYFLWLQRGDKHVMILIIFQLINKISEEGKRHNLIVIIFLHFDLDFNNCLVGKLTKVLELLIAKEKEGIRIVYRHIYIYMKAHKYGISDNNLEMH